VLQPVLERGSIGFLVGTCKFLLSMKD